MQIEADEEAYLSSDTSSIGSVFKVTPSILPPILVCNKPLTALPVRQAPCYIACARSPPLPCLFNDESLLVPLVLQNPSYLAFNEFLTTSLTQLS